MFELLENPKESELTNNNIDQELKFQSLTFHSRSRKFTRGLCKYSLNSRIVREMVCGENKTFSMNEMEMLANKSVFINKTGQLDSFKEYLVLKNGKRLTVCKDYWPGNCSYSYIEVKNESDWSIFENGSVYTHVNNKVWLNYG
ncbi:Hypothetical predicted protein, partial [Paramuricea clavata]